MRVNAAYGLAALALVARLSSDWIFPSGGPLAYQALQAALLVLALALLYPRLDVVFLTGGDLRSSVRLGAVVLPIALLGGLALSFSASGHLGLPGVGVVLGVVGNNVFFCAVEELEFRGFLLSWLLNRGVPPVAAVWAQAAVFVCAHPHWIIQGRWSMVALVAVLGWWLGTIVVRTKNIWGAYLAHFGGNVLLFLPQYGVGTYAR